MTGAQLATDVHMLPPVLCYHKVERQRELGVTRLSPRKFATQVHSLAVAGWRGLTLSEFCAIVAGRRRPRARELLITFDDAYRGLRDYAFPVLRDAGFGAACFVITDYAGRLNRWDVAYGGRRFAHLTWRDIDRWHARGIDFGSHTATHPRLPWIDDRRLDDELQRSRQALAAALGAPASAIAYPFGSVSAREMLAATRAGYTVGFGVGGRWDNNPMVVPRAPIHCWSPCLPVGGVQAWAAGLASAAAARCAVGTTLLRSLTRTASA
jgi:peptidoglycan/xylan/chitin deacetylase (PgdA/CDA1 family)